ncbi:hypothetical protein [Formosa sp. PL04]|uniref:hypothetical protein n=1 Tax=Formosa sp. PL04 TaxID=3081755 RepID=UPI0029817A2B|nr:hypothetical protein [Formosa sp. PL04]MDW5289007.1 hypothetical protein [Formosa sp. PL04]
MTSMLVGTKTIYLFNLLFVLYLSFRYFNAYIIIFSVILFLGTTVFYFPFFMDLFKTNFRVLYDVYINNGLLTMLFSYRDQSISEILIPYIEQYWGFFNYIFGGAQFDWGRTEIELIDLFWFFGAFGSLLYLSFFYSIFLQLFFKDKDLKIPMTFLLICVVLAGSFFTNSPVIPYFIALYFMVYTTNLKLN